MSERDRKEERPPEREEDAARPRPPRRPETDKRPVPGIEHEPEPDGENLMPAEDRPGTF